MLYAVSLGSVCYYIPDGRVRPADPAHNTNPRYIAGAPLLLLPCLLLLLLRAAAPNASWRNIPHGKRHNRSSHHGELTPTPAWCRGSHTVKRKADCPTGTTCTRPAGGFSGGLFGEWLRGGEPAPWRTEYVRRSATLGASSCARADLFVRVWACACVCVR